MDYKIGKMRHAITNFQGYLIAKRKADHFK